MSPPESKNEYKEILDGYDDFRTCVIVESLRATTNFGHLDAQRRMISGDIRLVSRFSHNNKNTTVPSTFLVTYLCESYRIVIV